MNKNLHNIKKDQISNYNLNIYPKTICGYILKEGQDFIQYQHPEYSNIHFEAQQRAAGIGIEIHIETDKTGNINSQLDKLKKLIFTKFPKVLINKQNSRIVEFMEIAKKPYAKTPNELVEWHLQRFIEEYSSLLNQCVSQTIVKQNSTKTTVTSCVNTTINNFNDFKKIYHTVVTAQQKVTALEQSKNITWNKNSKTLPHNKEYELEVNRTNE